MKEWVNRVYSAADAGTPLQLMKKGSSVYDVPSSPADSMVHACTARRLKPEPQKKAISMLQPSPRSRVHLLQPSPRRDRRTAEIAALKATAAMTKDEVAALVSCSPLVRAEKPAAPAASAPAAAADSSGMAMCGGCGQHAVWCACSSIKLGSHVEADSITRHYTRQMSLEPSIAATYGLAGSVYTEQIVEPAAEPEYHTGFTPRLYPGAHTKATPAKRVNFIAKHSAAPASPLSPINGNAAAARSRATPAKYQTPGKPKGGLCTVKAAPGAKSKSARKRARKKKANKKAQRQGTGFATPREFVAPSPA